MIPNLQRENGQASVLFALLLVAIVGAIALSFDIGRAYLLKTRLQSAADSAALAAVRQINNPASALQAAVDFAARNGFVNGKDGTVVTGYPYPGNPNWYLVRISKPSRHMLASLIGQLTAPVAALAVAEFNAYVPIDITGGGTYGANGLMTLSVFGPCGYYSYGDAYSTKYNDNGSANSDYRNGGYDFGINVPSDYSTKNGTGVLQVQIFDPDTYNNGSDDAATGLRIDELRDAPPFPHPQPGNRRDTTVYKLYAPDSAPTDYSDDVLIAQATYGPNDTSTDMKWVTPQGFSFNINQYGTGRYRLNVAAIDGSSENGFNLRAGPPASTFNPNNGTSISALGAIPINFNGSGLVTIRLGYISAEAAGMKMHINKFDTDVGAKSIVYKCDTLSGSFSGTLSGNGTWKEDVVQIPQNYKGGTWTAQYTAGLQDTSVWSMWLQGLLSGQPGFVRLVE